MNLDSTALAYQSGFGNEFSSEALPGALPVGQNSPQKAPYGLYAELLSGTAFTMARSEARRTWLYRITPSAKHPPFRRLERQIAGAELDAPTPNRLRWDPLALPEQPTDFLDGLLRMAANAPGDKPAGVSIYQYLANRSMERCFYDADGELLLVPQLGRLRLCTELGALQVEPLEIAVIPRGMKFRVELLDGEARGYIAENHGAPLRLPDLGPIGSNGLANPRDFLAPVARYEDSRQPLQLVQKYLGELWACELDHSPLDVVAWHGNNVPYKYDLRRFNTIGTVSFDHPDPSIFTVLTSPTSVHGLANIDFVIFPPRWMVAENTFRPPWFHRNLMNEFMGLIQGAYDAKAGGFVPGGASLHSCMSAHGPDAESCDKAIAADLKPHRIDQTMAFMFETSQVLRPSRAAARIGDYTDFYVGIRHAENVGKLFRPDNPLLPNYKHVPIGYHGRASTVRVSGSEVRRPNGQTLPAGASEPVFGPCARLDYELELGIWIGQGNALGEAIPVSRAAEHIAGFCLLNDWSARDIQAWEYQPLGPFLSKSFITSVSPWVVTAEALEPFRRAQPARPEGDPRPLPYLYDDNDQAHGAFDIELEVLLLTEGLREKGLPPQRLTLSNSLSMYWTVAQMVAHHSVNGCQLQPGDLFGSGTLSGAEPGQFGSLLEITAGGKQPVQLASGETRRFLEDGDEVILRARCKREGHVSIGFGECRGKVLAAHPGARG